MSIKVRNFKCFGEKAEGFEKVCPINIIIGKNNAGKSSLIDLIAFAIAPKEYRLQKKSQSGTCIVKIRLTQSVINNAVAVYERDQNGNAEWSVSISNHIKDNLIPSELNFEIDSNGVLRELFPATIFGQYRDAFMEVFRQPFSAKRFRRITAERDIVKERYGGDEKLRSNGQFATSLIWKFLSDSTRDHDIIKKEFLSALNEIANPDIYFYDIIIKHENIDGTLNQGNLGEIYFEVEKGLWVELSKMGSGVKTIMLVLLNLIVEPKLEATSVSNFYFGFEELENNLHPSLQRRLYHFLLKFVIDNKCVLFLSTHSNIVLDVFGSNDNAQLLHITKRETCLSIDSIDNHQSGKKLLKDLDYRASDLLFSNGILWVEGPSDVIYIRLFLELYMREEKLASNLSFCLQSLSTAIWKYAGFEDFNWSTIAEDVENKIISLAKLNHNNLLIIDKDNNYENRPPSEFNSFNHGTGKNKARLVNEFMRFHNHQEEKLVDYSGDTISDTLFFWINDYTVESYLIHFLANGGAEFAKYFQPITKHGYLQKRIKGSNSSISKVELAGKISHFCFDKDVQFSDMAPLGSTLRNKIHRLYNTLELWNT